MEEVIDVYQNDAWRGDQSTIDQKIYWWHRKNKGTGLWSYENGIVLKAGSDWKIKKNWIHDAFEAVTGGGGTWSRNLLVEENLIERMVDNAFETEDHAMGFQARSNWIIDVFEPFSWQPLDGEPYPGDAVLTQNRLYDTPSRWTLWSSAGGAPGIFKMGLERAKRPTGDEPWAPSVSPGSGFIARSNLIFTPGHRIITTVQPRQRPFDNFFIEQNVLAVSNESSGFTNDDRGVHFEKNTVAFHAPDLGRSLEVLAGKNGKQIPSGDWLAWIDSDEIKKLFGPDWLGWAKGWKLPVVGREVGPLVR
jgi:hypothetical protein